MSFETDLAWAAGFIDGEGCIYIAESRGYYKLVISVGNTNRESVDKLKTIFNCGTIIHKKSNPSKNQKEFYIYRSTGNDAYNIIQLIRDYTIIKRLQIDVGIKFQESTIVGGNIPRDKIYHSFRKECYEQIKKLKE